MKIAFFVKKDLDTFIDYVISTLAVEYETRKVIIEDNSQIEQELKSTDIAWFEWCDSLIAYASTLPVAREKRIVCRLHSYEAFTDYPACVTWPAVDKIIFVAEHIRNYTISKFNIDRSKTTVIPNAVCTDNYDWKARTHGYNVAYAGYVNYKKGPMLLLHTFKAMHDTDQRYKLHVAGVFQDERYALYFKQMIPALRLEGSVVFDGWQNDLNAWLEDKHYILCTSILESQNLSVMQAMAKGIKPIVHHFVGAESIYPADCLFNSIPDAVDMLKGPYDSAYYRQIVESYCGAEKTKRMLCSEIASLPPYGSKIPLVSVVMTVFNREHYLREAIQSVLDQSYTNIELIIVNDGSTDSSEDIVKSFTDARIQYIFKERSGQLDTLKAGILEAKGCYIARLDSDDCFDRDYVSACMDAIQGSESTQFVYTDMLNIGPDGELMGITHLKEYNDPNDVIFDMFTGFVSVIPDVSFWRKEYAEQVIVNYADQNVPFYVDNILNTHYKHIARPLYHYRQHTENFAMNQENLKYVLQGKIKFIDLILRKYFIQSDLFGVFRQDTASFLQFFAEYYKTLGNLFTHASFVDGIPALFAEQSEFWLNRFIKPDEPADKCLNPRILLVSADDPRNGTSVGGKHTHIHLLEKALKEKHVSCTLVVCQLRNDIMIDQSSLIQDFNTPQEVLNSNDNSFLYLIYAMQKQLQGKIMAHLQHHFVSCISCQDVIAAVAAQCALSELQLKIPIVTTLHGYFTDENVDYGLLHRDSPVYGYFLAYEKKAYESSARIVAVDTRILEYVTKTIGEEHGKNVILLKNAVDDRTFYPSNDTAFSGTNIILVPRRLVPKNGVQHAVIAARVLLDRGITNFHMLLAGDGIVRPAIEGLISENHLESHVTMLGAVPHDCVKTLFDSAKIIVIPSIPSNNVEEATSISALEGMACGKVVVASRIGGLKELICDGQNGFLIEPGNDIVLADILEKLIHMDSAEYQRISMAARSVIKKEYGYKAHAQKLLSIFCETANAFLKQ